MNVAHGSDKLAEALASRTAYGFVVSQAIYDALKEQIPQKFEGGNCINGTPIVVDPALPSAACDVAYTREAWNKRLREIG